MKNVKDKLQKIIDDSKKPNKNQESFDEWKFWGILLWILLAILAVFRHYKDEIINLLT